MDCMWDGLMGCAARSVERGRSRLGQCRYEMAQAHIARDSQLEMYKLNHAISRVLRRVTAEGFWTWL